MSFPQISHISEETTHDTYTTEKRPVGSLAMAEDGRVYRFIENGGTALVSARMNQARLEVVADTSGMPIDTLAVGVTVLTGIGVDNTAIAADVLKYGYCFTDTAADLNPVYRIKSNTALIVATDTAKFTLYSPTVAAIAAATTITYMRHPCRDTIIAVATTPTAMVLGATVNAVPADNFGWICSRGPARVLTQGTLVIGDPCGPGTDAGSVRDLAAGSAETNPVYGVVLRVEATTECSLVFLQID